MLKSKYADTFSSLIMSLSRPQSFLYRHVLSCWFPRLTHHPTFGEWMWLCGILTCLLTTEEVKWRTTSQLLHDRNASGPHQPLFLFSTHNKLLLQRESCWPRVKGQQNRLFSQLVSTQTRIWGQPHSHPILTYLCFSIYSTLLMVLSHLLFIYEKTETCPVCFSPSLGWVPTFKAQVLVSRESTFRKTGGRSQG